MSVDAVFRHFFYDDRLGALSDPVAQPERKGIGDVVAV